MSEKSIASHSLDTPPKTKVVRLNQLPLYLLAGLLIIVLIGGVELLPQRDTHSLSDTTLNAAAQIAVASDKDWYQNQSNALPKRILSTFSTNTTLSGHTIVTNDINTGDSDYKKQRAEGLIAAMNSPLTASNSSPNTALTNTNSENPIISAMKNFSASTTPTKTAIDSSLPMSAQQINKLQHLFGATATQSQQDQKIAFIKNLKNSSQADYLSEEVTKPLSHYELKAGTLIPAITIGGINSDLPGQITAQVRQNVYDTVSGKYLLVPQGAHLILTYDSRVAFGQSRVLIAVKRIIFPNGKSLDIEGMPGVDISGYSGFHDQVNNHYFKIFGSAAALGLISAAFQLSQPQQSNALSNPNTGQTAAAAVGQQMAQVSSNMINKNLNIQPTLEIRPGYLFNVQITADMVFPGEYRDEEL